jgi:hypothetical protein
MLKIEDLCNKVCLTHTYIGHIAKSLKFFPFSLSYLSEWRNQML